ncbi:NADH dehydrogenase [ubiquinone] 1 alpha subcomplex assembly factor 3 [Penicillium griseofulvum]|uniref:Alkaline phosphatase n=1 Tax=Penicillium patulum TaxID=5078 RepID=A0A135LDY2_PENPA|nr:NADH dehydrogenase [ubiquinone] 1 alpha subcomplex assembly factor 3 [Penicillium griseofulvum]KXG47177.1 NADH dehydrogenase [ubiquinone] 1 alpha subcomplex assembly factor 3 [Penicillium griseofulvum]
MHSPSPQLLRLLRTSLANTRRNSNLTRFCQIPSATAAPCLVSNTSSDIPSARRNYSSPIRPTRMIPRSHAHKPVSRDRGPESKEDTQTNFDALNVLGNIPAPTTAIDACLDSGFHLNNGVKLTNGDGLLLVGGEAFAWRPWKAVEGAESDRVAKDAMLNSKGQFELDESVWGLLNLVWPKPDMLILGLGGSMFPLSPETRRHINSLGIRVDILDTRNAAAQFNLLATERGVTEIAAAMIPIGNVTWGRIIIPAPRSTRFDYLDLVFTAAMAREESLVPPRVSSDDGSSIPNEEEDYALLTGERTATENKRGWPSWREIGVFSWALIATILVIVLAVLYPHKSAEPHGHHGSNTTWGPGGKPTGKRNMIFMVSDGMGPTSLSLTRSFRQYTHDLPFDDILVLDKHYIGTSRTRSSSSLVTDSAAGATAFSCGRKSYNSAISVLPDHSPCGTVLEAAALAGYKTGLVVTTRLTDATPACFAAHANLRNYEDLIAAQEVGEHPLGRVVDLMLGGGRCHFLPNSQAGSCRGDDHDLIKVASENGFDYIDDRAGFDGLKGGDNATLPLLGLFAHGDIPYEIDRRTQNDTYPSLEEMTRTALKALSKATEDSEQGFFVLIEGSRIDHAGHGNDPAAQVHEVLAYDKAFAAALEFLENDSTPGVIVSTSDHETGGLAAARQLHKSYPEYLWLPSVLDKASHSGEYLAARLKEYISGPGKDAKDSTKQSWVRTLLKDGLGIDDATDKEVDALLHPDPQVTPAYVFADMISRRAQVGWSTHGHSAVDVNIYVSSSKDAWPLVGNNENTDVGNFLADYLDLNVDNVTKLLQDTKSGALQSYDWMGDRLGLNFHTDGLDTYHGDFRKRSADDCGCGASH